MDELGAGAFEHVDVDLGDWAEAAAFDEDCLFIERFGGLGDFASGGEEDRVGEAASHEVEIGYAVVDAFEGGSGEVDEIDFDAFGANVVDEGFDQFLDVVVKVEGSVDEVGAEDADGVLLLDVFGIPEASVQKDLVRRTAWAGLEANAHPAVGVVAAAVAFRLHGVGVGEEGAFVSDVVLEALFEEGVLVLEHFNDALDGYVASDFSVDGVAEGHVVGGHGLGDGSGGASSLEEVATGLLSCSDFSEGAVPQGIEIDGEGFAVGGEELAGFRMGVHIGGVWVRCMCV